LSKHADKLGRFPASRRVWFKDATHPLRAGDRIVQTDLARTLEQIADEGPDTLYRGQVGRAFIAEVECGGGIITSDDLERAYDEILQVRQPVQCYFNGWHLYGAPPPTAGGTLVSFIMMLFEPLAPEFEDDTIVVLAEALRIGLSKRSAFFGRPDLSPEDTEQFLSRSHLRACTDEVREQLGIRLGKGTTPTTVPQRLGVTNEETTHHSHLDSAGNCVVCTQSLGDGFGSGVTVEGCGLLLNNAMKLFDPQPNRPNAIAPFRKMLSSMSPTILMRDDGSILGLGSPSGTRIISAVSQTLVNHLWRDDALPDAVARPRIHVSDDQLEAEANLPENERATLARYGYEVRYLDRWNDWFGAVQAVKRTSGADLIGAADPRRNGTVIRYDTRQAIPSSYET
jgi:gamma-glutamyltranspeptidase/glutathione hydrolase